MRIKAKIRDGQEVYIIAINESTACVVSKDGRIGWCNLCNIEVIDEDYLPEER